jgi:hypothetical protein
VTGDAMGSTVPLQDDVTIVVVDVVDSRLD